MTTLHQESDGDNSTEELTVADLQRRLEEKRARLRRLRQGQGTIRDRELYARDVKRFEERTGTTWPGTLADDEAA